MVDQFLVYFPDPFGVGGSRYAIGNATELKMVSASEVAAIAYPLITYEVSTLIDDLRRNGAGIPSKLIDMSEAIRLVTGLSKSDGGQPKWNFWRKIRKSFDKDETWSRLYSIHESRAAIADIADEISLLTALCDACIRLWSLLQSELIKKKEHERFFTIEVPSARIFNYRQLRGIAVDEELVANCLEVAAKEKYVAYRDVAERLGISPTGLNYWNVSRHLLQTESAHLADTVTGYALRDQLKMSIDVSAFAKIFTEFMDASRDVDVLTRLSNTGGRTFPTFHPLGTISSRILVSDPYLQELRRKFRKVISADIGQQLVYFDYSQFEPGIMASLSNDPELIGIYNEGDVYSSLSRALFGDTAHRDLCKKIFLAFSYGMNASGISKLLVGDANSDTRPEIERKVAAFFERFAKLTEFKNARESELSTNGFVSTSLGNHRTRKKTDVALSARELRWATSQSIQGTASLIFKTALIKISEVFGPDQILLPMHDAVLMQFPENNLDASISNVTGLMISAFEQWCPKVNARITSGPFH